MAPFILLALFYAIPFVAIAIMIRPPPTSRDDPRPNRDAPILDWLVPLTLIPQYERDWATLRTHLIMLGMLGAFAAFIAFAIAMDWHK